VIDVSGSDIRDYARTQVYSATGGVGADVVIDPLEVLSLVPCVAMPGAVDWSLLALLPAIYRASRSTIFSSRH